MSELLKGLLGDYTGVYSGAYEGDTRSVDYGSCSKLHASMVGKLVCCNHFLGCKQPDPRTLKRGFGH